MKWGGATVGHTLWAGATSIPIPQFIDPATGSPASLQTGAEFVDLIIDLHPQGTLDVVYKGLTVYTNLVIPGYTPIAGHFVLSARTGGEFETHWVDDISITTVPPITGAASITTQPADASSPERGSVTFSVVPGGAPPHTFQWYTNGVAVDGAINATLTLDALSMGLNNAKVKVNVANAEGNLDSREATLTVVPDTLAARLRQPRQARRLRGLNSLNRISCSAKPTPRLIQSRSPTLLKALINSSRAPLIAPV